MAQMRYASSTILPHTVTLPTAPPPCLACTLDSTNTPLYLPSQALEALSPDSRAPAGDVVSAAVSASSPADIMVTASIPGWRRARPNEVTPEMVAAAREALKEPLGAVVDHGHFRVALEEHYWPEK